MMRIKRRVFHLMWTVTSIPSRIWIHEMECLFIRESKGYRERIKQRFHAVKALPPWDFDTCVSFPFASHTVPTHSLSIRQWFMPPALPHTVNDRAYGVLWKYY